jgi:hypothetical protein
LPAIGYSLNGNPENADCAVPLSGTRVSAAMIVSSCSWVYGTACSPQCPLTFFTVLPVSSTI